MRKQHNMISARSIARSVLVNDERRFVYLKIPKNACSTTVLRLWMAAHAAGEAPPAERKRVHTTDVPIWTGRPSSIDDPRYFSFAIVRNPFTRALSCYLNRITNPEDQIRNAFLAVTGIKRDSAISFLDFLKGISELDGEADNPHWRPQHRTMLFDYVSVDDVGYFEVYDASMTALLARLYGQDAANIASDMRAHRTDAHEKIEAYYCSEAVELVRKKFARDFELFGYDPGEPRCLAPSVSADLSSSGQRSKDRNFRLALSDSKMARGRR